MGKFLPSGKNQFAIISTILVLILLGACYFFIYIPKNEKTVQARRFRCLQDIDSNVHARIQSSVALINFYLKAHSNDSDDSLKKLNDYITNYYPKYYPHNNFTLLPIEKTATNLKGTTLLNVQNDSLITIQISQNLNSPEITLYASMPLNRKGANNESYYIKMGVRYKFEQFFKTVLPANVFDHYIIFNDKRKIYETFPSGLNYKTKDSLLQVKHGIVSPGLCSLNISGTDYKVFSQPVSLGGNNEWIISGVLSNKTYQTEKNQLPLWIMVLLITVAAVLIVSLPWIKLHQMGSKDKLTVRDGIASVLVAMLLMSLIFFIYFIYNFRSNYGRLSNSRNALVTRITKAFEKETEDAYQLLNTADSIYSTIPIDKKKPANAASKEIDTKGDTLLKKLTKDLAVHHVFWVSKKGILQNSWTNDLKVPANSDLSGRNYFRFTVNNQPNVTGPHPYYLEQIVSRTSGAFATIIAKKGRNNRAAVAALSFTAKSLDSVVMTEGYQFAVINASGKVLYHLRPELNLTENLKKEFADSSELVSCLEAKAEGNFNTKYYGKLCNVRVKPFENLPYFLVVIEDANFNDTRDIEVYSFTVSMLIFLLIFLAFQYSVIFIVSSKRSFFKKHLFETAWIAPRITSHRQYNLAIVANAVVILLLTIFFNFCSFLGYLFIILFSINFISIFLNSLFAVSYKDTNQYNFGFKIIAIKWLMLFVAVVDYLAWKLLDLNNFFILLLFEVSATVLCLAACQLTSYLRKKAATRKIAMPIKWDYTNSFSLMATTRLIVTSGIPVVFFFIYSFNYEQSLVTRYRQFNFIKSFIQKVPAAKINQAELDRIRALENNSGIYYDGIFVRNIEPVKQDSTTDYSDYIEKARIDKVTEESTTVAVLSAFRMFENDIAIKNKNMNLSYLGNEASFNSLTEEQTGRIYTTCTYKQINPKLKVTSLIILDAPDIIFWLKLIIPIIIFYFAIHHIIKKLFALNLPTDSAWRTMNEQLILDAELNRLLLIVGSPGSGKLSKLKKRIRDGELCGNDKMPLVLDTTADTRCNVYIADMILIPVDGDENDVDWKRCKKEALKDHSLVVINHFEYNIKDHKTNLIKLDLLEALMLKGVSKLIIISSVHPLTFLDSFNEQQSNAIPESELERWHVLLGHFRIVIEPLECKEPDKEPDMLKQIIMEETQYTHYLNKMQKMTLDTAPEADDEDTGKISDSLIFKIQITSHYFYTYIWQSLTKEEKFLLYDLAEEGLVNPYDDYNLSMLISKGLIIKPNGTLMLFNKGFRNYILTAIGNTEVNRIKAQVKDNGNWSNLKAPMNLAIAAILIFLFASQQEAYSRIITYVTALGAGVPLVLKALSLFNSNSTQKTQ